jgi:DNA polymerase-3 subunit delta'
MLFKSEKKAENFIKYNSDEILNETGIAPVRAYYCPFCGGWHITSSAVQYTRKNSDRYLSAVSFWGQNKQHLKQVSKEMKDEMLDLMRYMDQMELYEVVDAIKRINNYKTDIDEFLDLMTVWFRDVLLFKATMEISPLIFKDELATIRKRASKSSYEGLEEIIRAIDKARVRLKANVNFDLVMELLLLTIKEN